MSEKDPKDILARKNQEQGTLGTNRARMCSRRDRQAQMELDRPHFAEAGAIIRDGGRKRAQFLVLGLAPWYGTIFSIFRTNCAIACGTRACIAARIFADVAQGKWRPKFPKSFRFILLAHNSGPLWQLEFCSSIFAVSCSSLNEDSAEFRYVPLRFIMLIKLSSAAALKKTSHYSNLHMKKINSFSITQKKKLVGYVWI